MKCLPEFLPGSIMTLHKDSLVSSLHLLVHGSHLRWQRQESVSRQVELGERGHVAQGRRELAQSVVGQTEAPEFTEPRRRGVSCESFSRGL